MQNFIVNIDSTKKYFVNSVNQRMINKCVIDCAETEQFNFSFVDKCGTPVELKENMQYYLAVSKERNNAGTILIFDDNPTVDGNSIIFNLNSKTEEYLSIIKNKTECWIEIGEKQLGADNYNILLQDNCICLPKVYVIGVPTELESYYTKTESDALFATKEQLNNDYYTKEESEERFLDKSEVLNDFYTKDETNSTFATKAELPTKVSELENDSGFISSYTETDPIFTSISATLATKEELPTKVSELTNDSGFITEQDVVYPVTSVNGKTGAISLSTSDLINDLGFIRYRDTIAKKIKYDTDTTESVINVTFDSSYYVFYKTNYNISGGVMYFGAPYLPTGGSFVSDERVITFEVWVPASSEITTFTFSAVVPIDFPETLPLIEGQDITTHVFVYRMFYPTADSTNILDYKYQISYSYSF